MRFFKKPPLYAHPDADSESTIKEESESVLLRPATSSRHVTLLYFIIAFLMLNQLLLVTLMPMPIQQGHLGSYETGFDTEMRMLYPIQAFVCLH
jgi:hypothetical protein